MAWLSLKSWYPWLSKAEGDSRESERCVSYLITTKVKYTNIS